MMSSVNIDPARLAIFDSLVSSIAEEMGAALRHTSLSPNIKERADFSCAVFDHEGQLLAQAAHIPVHLGAMPEVGAGGRAAGSVAAGRPGDPERPVPRRDASARRDDGLAGLRAWRNGRRRADRIRRQPRAPGRYRRDGRPGSMPVARELIQEGLVIPPIRLYRAGELVEEALDLILRNVRTPDERRGDFNAQIAAQRLGERRIADLQRDYGDDAYRRTTEALLDYGERLTRAALADLPHGTWEFSDSLDDDGHTPDPVPIKLTLTLTDDRAHFDFSSSAPQAGGVDQRGGAGDSVGLLLRDSLFAAPRYADELRAVPSDHVHAARAIRGRGASASGGRGGQCRDLAADRRHGLGRVQPAAARADAGCVIGDDE